MYTKKELCIKLVIYKNWTEMHGQQDMKSNTAIYLHIYISLAHTNKHTRLQSGQSKTSNKCTVPYCTANIY